MEEKKQNSPGEISIFWFRRDFRLHDNKGLFYALKNNSNVLPVFIFDSEILDHLSSADKRVEFIHQEIQSLQKALKKTGSSIYVEHGNPIMVFKNILSRYSVGQVFFNHDYEPYALERDKEITAFLENKGIKVHTFKDQVIAEKDNILKKDGKPYTVYTPYMKKWKEKYTAEQIEKYPSEKHKNNFLKVNPLKTPTLKEMGFQSTGQQFPERSFNEELIRNYHNTRDLPSIKGTSRLSIHFRFGTISIREAFRKAFELNETWLNELIWREFYMMILWHFPGVTDHAFKTAYDNIEWRNNEKEFTAWYRGKTGYPMVDAGLRELNETGYMHNRVRMIAASFLTKHLLIDWRWGESYFAEKLLDYELSSNNGGWQWAAGSGCDAAPYFRIFNPEIQAKKFDPELKYIKRWVPELGRQDYPQPIVEHKFARERALYNYKKALNKK